MTGGKAQEVSLAILAAVDDSRKEAATKALDVSLNELADMYESKELKINPEYQRLFRWPSAKQSQFIESLLLEMPVPPIFVIEIAEGVWELIDGLQRVSSYLHFRGDLAAPHVPIKLGQKLTLTGCDIVEALNGKTFDKLPTALQIRLKRSFLRVEVIRQETDKRFRYYMFKRLNTGGEPLSEQEVRNCTIRLLGERFNDFIVDLSENKHFNDCIDALTHGARAQMEDVALVLRYLAFKNNMEKFKHDIGPFMTDYMEGVTEGRISFDYTAEKQQFERVVEVLSRSLGEGTCKRWKGGGFVGGFSTHHYEAFMVGLGNLAHKLDPTKWDAIQPTLMAIKKDPKFIKLTQGGGQNSKGLYKKKIAFVEDRVRDKL